MSTSPLASSGAAAPPGSVVVDAKGLRKRFADGSASRQVLDGADLEVNAGELLAILGASGSGKSTLLGILGGLDRSWEGRLTVFGHDVPALSDADLSRLRGERIGFVFQAFHLLAHLSVLENVLAPSLFAGGTKDHTPRAHALLVRLGLGERATDAIAHLSGGQRQRVAIARALLFRPALLLCDEPTGNLDDETGLAISALFRDLAHEEGVAVVAATHSGRLTEAADRVLHLEAGKLR